MKHILSVVAIIIIAAIMYGGTLRGMNGNYNDPSQLSSQIKVTGPFETSHERSPYALLLSWLTYHSVSLSQQLADFASPDVGIYDSKYFSYFPPGVSAVVAPFYLLGLQFNMGLLFIHIGISIFSILTLIVMYLIGIQILRLRSVLVIICVFTYAFATTSWSYAITIYQHSITTLLLLSGFYAAWHYGRNGKLSFLWGIVVWTTYGLSIWVDYPNILLLAPIICYFFYRSLIIAHEKQGIAVTFRLNFLLTCIPFILLMFSLGYYQQYHFGNMFRMSNFLPRYHKQEPTQAEQTSTQKSAPKNKYLDETRIVNGLTTLLFSPNRGIFFYSPILIAGLFGIYGGIRRRNREIVFLSGVATVNLLMYASLTDPWGGWTYGPRYLIPSMAILSLMMGRFLAQYKHILVQLTIFFLTVISVAFAALGVLTSNLIPPIVEAVPLNLDSTITMNIKLLQSNQTSNYVYTTYLAPHLQLAQYYFVLCTILTIVFFSLYTYYTFTELRR